MRSVVQHEVGVHRRVRWLRCTGLIVLVGTMLWAVTACGSSGGATSPATTAPPPTSSTPASSTPASNTSSGTASANSVPITIATGSNGQRVPLVRVSVGGGPEVKVVLDTGSIGLVVRANVIGSAAKQTGATFSRTYTGFSVHGRIESAGVRLPGGPDPVESSALGVGAVDGALTTFLQSIGASGILGVAPGQNNATKPQLLSPLSELPGSSADGYLIDLRANRLLLGAPDDAGAARVALTKTGWTYPNGLAGFEKQIKAEWTIGGRRAGLPTTIDTGGREGNYARSLLPPAAISGTRLESGTKVELVVGGQTVLDFTAGSGSSPAPVVSDSQTVMNTGLPAFDTTRIGFDLRRGQLVLEPY